MENMLNRSGKKESQGKCVGLITPISALAACARARPVCVPVCVPPCARVCARSLGPLGRAWGSRASPRAGARPGGDPRGSVCLCAPSAPFPAPLGTGSPRGGGRRRPLSLRCPLPRVYDYSAGRAPPPPWQLAGPCSVLAAFSPGAPPNRLLHRLRLLICLKSHRTSRRRSPRGAGRPGCRVGVRPAGGGAGRPLCPQAARRSGGRAGRAGRAGRGVRAGCAHVGRPPTGPRAADSCRVSSLLRRRRGSTAAARLGRWRRASPIRISSLFTSTPAAEPGRAREALRQRHTLS